MKARVMDLVHDTSSHHALFIEISLTIFELIRADMICDGQTDARGKTICLPTLTGGHIIISTKIN